MPQAACGNWAGGACHETPGLGYRPARKSAKGPTLPGPGAGRAGVWYSSGTIAPGRRQQGIYLGPQGGPACPLRLGKLGQRVGVADEGQIRVGLPERHERESQDTIMGVAAVEEL